MDVSKGMKFLFLSSLEKSEATFESKLKTLPKGLDKQKFTTKKIFIVKLAFGSDSANDYDLQGGKFKISLKLSLKKPLNLFM